MAHWSETVLINESLIVAGVVVEVNGRKDTELNKEDCFLLMPWRWEAIVQ